MQFEHKVRYPNIKGFPTVRSGCANAIPIIELNPSKRTRIAVTQWCIWINDVE